MVLGRFRKGEERGRGRSAPQAKKKSPAAQKHKKIHEFWVQPSPTRIYIYFCSFRKFWLFYQDIYYYTVKGHFDGKVSLGTRAVNFGGFEPISMAYACASERSVFSQLSNFICYLFQYWRLLPLPPRSSKLRFSNREIPVFWT